ncbi:MAG: glycosyltransferase family 2 protein [Flavobacteriaceae bacterium]|nr:glycosyltransferase family 2 protein [Flavobacteriaceae bacterium]
MPFSFLKYLQPTHYFALKKQDGTSVFPIVEELPNEIYSQLKKDSNYKSTLAQQYDLSWQAIQKGYIGNTKTYTEFKKSPIEDEYRFIRKYFNKVWASYILILRLLSFKNPLKEISAWNKARNTKRSNYLDAPIPYPAWENFQSNLIKENPKVSVVIPTLNRYEYLKDILQDLEKQDYQNFEVIVVDQSEPFQKEFYNDFKLDINLIHQEEKALWLARNTAVKNANGTLIALSEDDVRVQSNWISNHIKSIDFFNAQISAGVFFPEGSSIPKERSFFSVASQFATGNAMLYKDVFKQIGLFDRQFEKQRMGDGEFGLRAYLNGIKSISTPFASCIDVKAPVGGLRQMGSWDAFRPKKWFSPRPIPSVLYLFRKYYGTKRSILALLKTIPASIMPYRFKRNKKLKIVGAFVSIVIFPLIMIQVFISWKKASDKLKQGALIEKL